MRLSQPQRSLSVPVLDTDDSLGPVQGHCCLRGDDGSKQGLGLRLRARVDGPSQVMKMFSFHRVGVMDGPFYTQGAKDFFLELIQRDLDAGTYGWTVLLDRTVGSPADAISVADDVLARDSRINLMVLPEYMGMWVLCQFFLRDMLPPDQRISESRALIWRVP